ATDRADVERLAAEYVHLRSVRRAIDAQHRYAPVLDAHDGKMVQSHRRLGRQLRAAERVLAQIRARQSPSLPGAWAGKFPAELARQARALEHDLPVVAASAEEAASEAERLAAAANAAAGTKTPAEQMAAAAAKAAAA